MTNEERSKLENQHQEAENHAGALHAIAMKATEGSETARQFKKMADKAFQEAESLYQASIGKNPAP